MRVFIFACAALALAIIGALLPRAQGRLDATSLKQPPVAHSAPWPAWAHGATAAAVSAPAPAKEPPSGMAAPAQPEKQATGEHTGLTGAADAVKSPAWQVQPVQLATARLAGHSPPVLSPPPRAET